MKKVSTMKKASLILGINELELIRNIYTYLKYQAIIYYMYNEV